GREQGRCAWRGLDQMLEVVEQEQQRAIADRILERSRDPQRARCAFEDGLRIADRRERHPPDPARITVRRGAGRREGGERCVAAAAGAGEGQWARVGGGEQPADRRKLVLAAEERRRRDGQIRLEERLQRWVVAGAELEDPLRRGEVLEAVLAEV